MTSRISFQPLTSATIARHGRAPHVVAVPHSIPVVIAVVMSSHHAGRSPFSLVAAAD